MRVLAADGTNIAMRAVMAIPMAPPADQAALALRFLREGVVTSEATHVIVAWDAKGKTFRHALSERYQRDRTLDTSEMVSHVRALFTECGLTAVECEGFEGDDCIATVVHRTKQAGHDACALSGDKDMLQLVDDDVCVYLVVAKGDGDNGSRIKRFTPAEVQTRFKLPAGVSYHEYKVLIGDSGDGVDGVVGIGKKKAIDILRRWKTIAKAVEATTFVSAKDVTALLAGKDAEIALSRALITPRIDVPLAPFVPSACRVDRVDWRRRLDTAVTG